MKNPAHVLDMILPRWRQLLPLDLPRPYFDAFVARQRAALEAMVAAWLQRREARLARGPEGQTSVKRTRRNLEAMRIVATRRPQDMTAEERRVVLGYSGWGGLSITEVADQFPPDFAPDDFALVHEYYTPVRIAEAIADLVCPLLPELAGYDGVVRALEPNVGIGRLIRPLGPPRCLVTDPRFKEIRWTAVELSTVSARMFAAMRPDVELYPISLEQWMSEHSPRYQGTLSLILANPPYNERGAYARLDKHPDYQDPEAFAYVMRRCLDLLVPGGVGVFIVPRKLLTSSTTRKLREQILRRHHLMASFRLPNKSKDGKEVIPGAHNVVDVLVWRARGGELGTIDEGDRFILEGRYYEEYPAHILGTEHLQQDEKPKKPGDRPRQRYHVLGDFTGFPAFTPRPMCRSCALRNLPALESRVAESVVRDMGDAPGDVGEELKHAMALGRRVDRYLALVAAEDERALGLWPELHAALESLRNTPALVDHGQNPWRWLELRNLAERRAVAQRLLTAYQQTGELAPSVATAPNIQPRFRAQPDDVLAQAEHLYRRSRHLTLDALTQFHREQGGKRTLADILGILLAASWCLDGDAWHELEPEHVYLTGQLWPKHDRAATRTAADPQAARQLQRLVAVMNLAVFEDIRDVSPRQGWVPMDFVSAWVSEALNARYGAVQLERRGGMVSVHGREYEQLENLTASLTPQTLWCLGWMNHDKELFKPKLKDDEIEALEREEAAATGQENKQTEMEDEKDEEKDIKLGQIRLLLGRHWDRAFARWVADRDERRAAVTEAYNRSFRGTIVPTFAGETLKVARWNEQGPQLRPHQVAGIHRLLHFGGGLLAYDVGVGKTYTGIGFLACMRESGRARRPVILVSSSLVWQWYDNIMCVLPDYRVAVIGSNRKYISRGSRRGQITSETDTPEERAAKWSALQAGLIDVVILSYDALGRTKLNEDALLEYVGKVEGIQRQIKLAQRNAAEKKKANLTERDEAILKHGVRAWVEENLELPEDRKFDPGIAWDDIGIDLLIVDEATAFKNSYKPEPREHGIPKFMGNPGDGSKRAWQLDFRAAAVRRRAHGAGIVLLTATPAKNSPLEFYNLIQLIDPHAFTRRGLLDPEQFIDRFLQIESRQIIDITLKVATRSVVDGFKNLDDLRTIVHTYGEFVSPKDAGLSVPEPRSEQVVVPMNDEQEELYAELVGKIEQQLRRMKTKGGSSNAILGLLARLSMYALHPKLGHGIEYKDALKAVHPEFYAAPKLLACAERIAASPGCGHIVFCEPTAVHQWLREVLVSKKIPRERIAILNATETKPAERNRVANMFNGLKAEPPEPGVCAAGTAQRVPPAYDVLIVNSVANEGLDIQFRTCAIHHLDLPWTSSDLEQRNGRGVRQGNENAVVQIFYYLSARSMDWYRYQLIQGKRSWLSAILESQARDTSNPGAQKSLSDEEILMMISRDPESTKRAIDERRDRLRADARRKVAREASSLLIQASARFRDARDTSDAERAARLRAEGEERLRDLQRIDVDAWPWAKWTTSVREVEYMVADADAAPVFEGLRVGVVLQDAAPVYFEFGRILELPDVGRRIGRRDLGSPIWELHSAEDIRTLEIQPSELDAGKDWPVEEEQGFSGVLTDHVDRVLVPGATFADLGWVAASDTWLSRWWPALARKVREGLVRAGRRAPSPPAVADDDADVPMYPALHDGRLVLAAGPDLRGELIAPTLAGWRQFLEAVPRSGLKYGELRHSAQMWWQRKLPRGLLGAEVDADEPDPVSAAEPELPGDVSPPVKAVTPAAPPPSTFADRVTGMFNRTPGFRLRLESRRGFGTVTDRSVFVVTPEGREDVIASFDVSDGHITDVRWLGGLRPAQQQSLQDRLERALADAMLADAAEGDMALPDAGSSLTPLIEALDRLGRLKYGMNVDRAQKSSRNDSLRDLADHLKDLASPSTTTPEVLAQRLEDEGGGLAAAAEVLRDPDILAFDSVDQLLDKLWNALDAAVPLWAVKRRSGGVAVESLAIGGTPEAPSVLVREKGRDTRYRLRSVVVEIVARERNLAAIVPKSGELRSGAEVYSLATRQEPFIRDLHAQVAELEHTLQSAPRLLSDVRQLLLVAGALIDTHRCQGKEQAAALRAFEQAKRYHDAARSMLVAGKTAVAAERIHEAMRRIAIAAAHITEDCAAGQQNFIPAKLHVDPEDAAVLEET